MASLKLSTEALPDANTGKELVVSENVAPELPPGERPVIVFQGLSDAQFDKALALFQPPPRTKFNLWKQKDYNENLIKVAAYCEANMFKRPDGGGCFTRKAIGVNFDTAMIQQFRNDDEDFYFSIDEWYNDSRGEIPAEIKDWDPKGYEPMPQVETDVDWPRVLTATDLKYPGFLAIFSNCIDLEEKYNAELQKRHQQASTTFGEHDGTKMPDPLNSAAHFQDFTPSTLLTGASGGLSFR